MINAAVLLEQRIRDSICDADVQPRKINVTQNKKGVNARIVYVLESTPDFENLRSVVEEETNVSMGWAFNPNRVGYANCHLKLDESSPLGSCVVTGSKLPDSRISKLFYTPRQRVEINAQGIRDYDQFEKLVSLISTYAQPR